MQVYPRVYLAFLVTKKVSVKKWYLSRLYLNIRSLVPRFLSKEVFSPSRFNLLVIWMVFSTISFDMLQILDSISVVTPLGLPAVVELISVHASALCTDLVESMDHNLIPPFIMREAGLEVDVQAKIHAKDASKKNHSIYSHEIRLRISLQ